jgi:hypothetical protein
MSEYMTIIYKINLRVRKACNHNRAGRHAMKLRHARPNVYKKIGWGCRIYYRNDTDQD